jgi:solute carrier family 25 phosphate transporter 23/24/25/41
MDRTIDFMIGGISGAVSRTLTAPLELKKIQSQNDFIKHTTLRDVLRKEGVFGLWKGNYTNIVRIFPQTAISYGVYSGTKDNLSPFELSQPVTHFISGCVGGLVAQSSIYPLENIRTRLSLQTNKSHYNGVIDCFKKVPLRQLYQGLGMSLLGFMPFNGLNFMFYDTYKRIFEYEKRGQLEKMMIGGLAGTSAVTITYPTDLIRRRLQIQGMQKDIPRYSGITDCVQKIVKLEGITGLYKGLGACYVKILPAIALQFYTIEFLKKNLK